MNDQDKPVSFLLRERLQELQDNQEAALELVNHVIDEHGHHIGTHYENCWQYHHACLASMVRYVLGGDNEKT